MLYNLLQFLTSADTKSEWSCGFVRQKVAIEVVTPMRSTPRHTPRRIHVDAPAPRRMSLQPVDMPQESSAQPAHVQLDSWDRESVNFDDENEMEPRRHEDGQHEETKLEDLEEIAKKIAGSRMSRMSARSSMTATFRPSIAENDADDDSFMDRSLAMSERSQYLMNRSEHATPNSLAQNELQDHEFNELFESTRQRFKNAMDSGRHFKEKTEKRQESHKGHVKEYQQALRQKFDTLGVKDGRKEAFEERDCVGAVREGVQKYHSHSLTLNRFYAEPGDADTHLAEEDFRELQHYTTILKKHGGLADDGMTA